MQKQAVLILRVFLVNLENQCLYRWIRIQTFERFIFVFIVFVTTEIVSCIHIKQ